MDTRPQRQRDVQLLGEMAAAGYAERQWLVQHGDRFLQLSELPYRVLDLADGYRTVPEIASELTLMTEWVVQPGDVQHLVDKLRVLGLIDGAVSQEFSVPRELPRSPLQLSMRMKLLPQRLVESLTNIFQHFYSRWFLLFMTVAVVIGHWWMYFGHGLEQGIESVLYRPGGLLSVIALGSVAGLFHEVGHASALKYSGGRPRAIGFGLYLFYPAFYSDVTDAYRLSRGARVRTDLGGIYFHFIFATVLIAIAALTESGFLLAAALLFNIEALRQFIPFVRLDGYWLLADLTGIPDLFSQALPFLRSLSPERFKGQKIPALKPWARNVFAAYLLITIPVLVYAFVMMLRYTPELAGHTWRALAFHYDVIRSAAPITTRWLSGTQMLLLPIPLLATAYFLYSLALSPLAAAGRQRLSPQATRLAAATACAAILLLAATAVGWTNAARDKSKELLHDTRASVEDIRTLEADVRGAIGSDEFQGRITLSRPNLARIDIRGGVSVGTFTVVSDGKQMYVYFPASGQYTVARAAANGQNINAFVVDQVRMFFAPERITNTSNGERLRYVGHDRIGDRAVDVVEIAPAHSNGITWRYAVSPDRVLTRVVAASPVKDGSAGIRWAQLENVRMNANIPPETFHWTPTGTRLGLGDLGVDLSSGRREP
jgi:putative peptide zinc metalloprotease protein